MNNLGTKQMNNLRADSRGDDGLTSGERAALAARYASRNARPHIGKSALAALEARRATRRAAR